MDFREAGGEGLEHHFYLRGKAALVESLLESLEIGGRPTILDAGAGTAELRALLARRGEPVFLDLDPRLAELLPGYRTIIADAADPGLDLPPFDVVLALDLLEHLADDEAALINFHRFLRPGGFLLLTVPAYPLLFSRHDRALGHLRRYRRKDLRRRVEEAGFTVLSSGHWNTAFFPLAAVWRLFGKMAPYGARSDLIRIPDPLNEIASAVLRAEARLAPEFSLPFGLTVWLVAQKPASSVVP